MMVHVFRLHLSGHYTRSVVQPTFHFRYDLVPSFLVPSPSRDMAVLHLGAMGLSALGIALGAFGRTSALLFAILYAQFVVSERTMFNNHYYLYILLALLLALSSSTACYSLDARLAGRRSTLTPMWEGDLIRLQICVVYFYAGVAKLNTDWLLHSEPMRTKLKSEASAYTPELSWLLTHPTFAQFISLAGAVFDLAIAPLLLHQSSRRLALVVCAAFHVRLLA